MPHIASVVALGLLAVGLSAPPAAARDRTEAAALAALARCPDPQLVADIRETFASDDRGAQASARKLGGRWLLTTSHGGSGRWAMFTVTHVLLDRRCRLAALTLSSMASARRSRVEAFHRGDGGDALVAPLLAELDLQIGDARDPAHAFGRFVRRRRPPGPVTRAGRRVAEGVEWLPGEPAAQVDTLWPDPPGAHPGAESGEPPPVGRTPWPAGARHATLVSGSPAPKPWTRRGRFALWRADEGRRFRRGREALAVYDRERDRHGWVLSTPLDDDSEGRMRYLGFSAGRFYVGVGSGSGGARVFAVDPARGVAFELGHLRVDADGPTAGGALPTTHLFVTYGEDSDARHVIRLDHAPAAKPADGAP